LKDPIIIDAQNHPAMTAIVTYLELFMFLHLAFI